MPRKGLETMALCDRGGERRAEPERTRTLCLMILSRKKQRKKRHEREHNRKCVYKTIKGGVAPVVFGHALGIVGKTS